jgi:hypothetical protein
VQAEAVHITRLQAVAEFARGNAGAGGRGERDGSTLVNSDMVQGLGGYNLAEATMLVIWLGALLVLGGLVFMMAQPIWRGRLSDATKRTSSGVPRDTLEPRRPGAGFTLKANWPGLVFIVLGSILLLVWAGLWSQ